jgi:hypothetical protein
MGRTILALALTLGMAATAAAQVPAAGEVGRVEGTAAVARGATPQPVPLKNRDDLLLRDLVTTGQQSKALLFLGQKGRPKATVTMREQSALRITEVPGVATVDMTDGLLKLSVIKDRMKPGDRVDVKTPNAITAVRGTTIVVEVLTSPSGPTTRLTVLNGFVDITPIDPLTGVPRGAPVRVNDLQQTSVTGTGAPTPPQPVNRNEAVRLDATFAFKLAPTATGDDVLKRQLEQAASDAAKLQGTTKLPGGTGDSGPAVTGDDIRSRTTPVPTAPPTQRGRTISPGGG